MELLNLNKVRKQSRQLVALFERLDAGSQQSLLDYAQWLVERRGAGQAPEAVPSKPLDIPRPETESVVKAIRRLTKTYPMVDRDKLFNETSSLMTQHVMHGREAKEIIDELEALFRNAYEQQERVE